MSADFNCTDPFQQLLIWFLAGCVCCSVFF